jgi:cytochrome c biogenesis protein CcmG/thiol:disulfide interchange protein DsbE
MNLRIPGLAVMLFASALFAGDEPRKPAPQFELTNAQGKTVKLSDFKGKVVLLNFWATWCVGCKQEIPWFVDFQSKYKDKGLVVLGVSLDDEGWKVLKPWLAEHPLNYPVILGNDDVATLYGGVDALPTTLLLDRTGKIVTSHAGVVDRATSEKDIQALLDEK